jgi:cytochrome c-type biogenesis protein CcmH/NrfF
VRRAGAALLALLALLAALALVPVGASAAAASLPDIEDEVMCTICGTTLQLASAPQAEREREFIRDLISQGKTKEEIKQALVAEYGENVLAVPDASGFGLAAFVVPIGGVLIALVAVGLAARRWRGRQATEAAGAAPPAANSDAESERLDSDLDRYHL